MPSEAHIQTALTLIENDESKVLGLNVGQHKDVRPGQYIPRAGVYPQVIQKEGEVDADVLNADAQSPPELFFTGLDSSKTYLIVALDIDAPFPSFKILGPILHWIQPGVKVAESGSLDTSAAPFVANYIGPAPPPGSAPHRYIFFLLEEPANFDVAAHAPPNGQKLSNWYRMRYDLDAWAKKVNLGPILAFNYFMSN
ncbi:Phosphatidylethanolamine-binding protein PEBP [Penicillium diatomitis]|uniref:Phosphatidylethanolamine-binding protein PEBP n=1 Tax=Penicillium diatomitis TaxID=2819901 RepID=A0A9X0C2G5_9EURO|nr:Phosphatidylethanolamine-binding protein PEBP [Penicillium diatomitis]KAJ5495039.1 Phosphatidylethanolamine-binding protein PEBP [Penicillium diatomitis]